MLGKSVYLRYLLALRPVNFSVLGIYQSFLKNESQAYIFKKFYDNYFLWSTLKYQMPIQVRCFKIYHSLRDDIDDLPTEEIKSAKKSRSMMRKNDVRIIVTNERGTMSSMFLSEAEKYAKHNKLSLIKLDNSHYRFEKELHKLIKKKYQKENFKKFIVRDSIADHDLQIKIKAMLKYVEKHGVLCIIENVDNKLDEVSNKINSAFKECVINSSKSSKRVIITLKKKDSTTESESNSSKENKFIETNKKNQQIVTNNSSKIT